MSLVANTGKLAGRTLFITGASRGIGKAIALKAAKDGANVVIAAKTAEPHPKLPGTIYTAAEEIEALGGKALPCIVDFNGIDILVNNASAIVLSGTGQTDMKRYDLMHNVNTRGTFLAPHHTSAIVLSGTGQTDMKRYDLMHNFNGIDILVNNASAIVLSGTGQTDMKRYDLMHNVNTRGTFLAPHHTSAIVLSGTGQTDMKRYDLMHNVNTRGTFLAPTPHVCDRAVGHRAERHEAIRPHAQCQHEGNIPGVSTFHRPHHTSAIVLSDTGQNDMKRYDLMHNVNTRGTFLTFSIHVAYTMAKYGMSMCVLGMSEEFKPFNIGATSPRAVSLRSCRMLRTSCFASNIDNLLPDFFLEIPGVTDQIAPKKVRQVP
ncbi:Hydroxysteroid dehydrogenase [Operophtera brumata]|uniref:Hydroxysteroid dehydrogenase n=1 Tax=Operophtera brumata TaxID=104452 RepID=A0A0L7KS71_OPEBR|nr:Hydroxysteroid dehydrogenase [Operophtera brumata]